jgi:hypothetical protein
MAARLRREVADFHLGQHAKKPGLCRSQTDLLQQMRCNSGLQNWSDVHFWWRLSFWLPPGEQKNAGCRILELIRANPQTLNFTLA